MYIIYKCLYTDTKKKNNTSFLLHTVCIQNQDKALLSWMLEKESLYL